MERRTNTNTTGQTDITDIIMLEILGGRPFHPSISSFVPSSIHSSSSSRKKMMEEEDYYEWR
jgi:hypothetical protein